MNKAMGVFGGTFDPIHNGHLRTAFELLQVLELEQVRFLPCALPPHRDVPLASAKDRLAMVESAVASQAQFVADDRELHRDGPSYSVDTLESLRAEFPDTPLCLIVGMDAFLGLVRWHRWQRIFELAHVIVAHRPGWRVPRRGPLGLLIAERGTRVARELHEQLAGLIYVHAVTQLEISSTEIRDLVSAGRDPQFLLPDSVRNLIVGSACYAKTPDGGNTD